MAELPVIPDINADPNIGSTPGSFQQDRSGDFLQSVDRATAWTDQNTHRWSLDSEVQSLLGRARGDGRFNTHRFNEPGKQLVSGGG